MRPPNPLWVVILGAVLAILIAVIDAWVIDRASLGNAPAIDLVLLGLGIGTLVGTTVPLGVNAVARTP